MSALDDHYRQQPAHEWYRAEQAERVAMYEEAEERGVSVQHVAYERAAADREWREADRARVRALINDPATLRALQAYWAPRPIAPDGTVAPLPPDPLAPPAPKPRDPNAPPSSGRSISPPRQR
jgi:hypothetical protein